MPAALKTKRPHYVLLIEDTAEHAELLTELLDRECSPVIVHAVDSYEQAGNFLQQSSYDLILSDAQVKQQALHQQIDSLLEYAKDTPFIVVTGSGDEQLAAQLIRAGITEYLVKTRDTLASLPALLKKHLKKRPRRRVKPGAKSLGATKVLSTQVVLMAELDELHEQLVKLQPSTAKPNKAFAKAFTHVEQLRSLICQQISS